MHHVCNFPLHLDGSADALTPCGYLRSGEGKFMSATYCRRDALPCREVNFEK